MSRLTIDLTDDQHKTLKAVAAIQGKTIRQFAVERLFPADDNEDQAWEELSQLLLKRIREAERSGFSNTTVTDIFDEEISKSEAA